MESQRPFLYIALLFVAYLIWNAWQQDQNPRPAVASNAVDTVQNVTDSAELPQASTAPVTNNAVAPAQPVASGQEQHIQVKTDVLHITISTLGGEVITADLPTYPVSLEQQDQPIRIFDQAQRNYSAQSGLLHQVQSGVDNKALAPDHLTLYISDKSSYQLAEGQDEISVPLLWRSESGVTVIKRYHFKRGAFAVKVSYEVDNQSSESWMGSAYYQLKHGLERSSGSGMLGVQAFEGGAYYVDEAYEKISFDEMKDGISASVQGGWISVMEHYFVGAWVPSADDTINYYSKETLNRGVPSYILGAMGSVQTIPAGSKGEISASFWVGPKLQNQLSDLATGLDLTVDYGIFAFISKPIFYVMQIIHGIVGNWGWTIIFLTLLIKLIFFYPSAKSYQSMARMKAVSPKMKEINDRFADNPQQKQKAMMELYRKEKINPLGGCLPILIQIPVFMGLYWVLLESVELRQAPWLLWYKDLSIRDPYFILPIIMGASMFLQQKLNPPPADPIQQKIFQFLPLIFTAMFLFFPAGLVLYWVVNNLLSIAQQWFINNKIIGKQAEAT